MKQETKDKLESIFKRNQVSLAYLFGSKVSGNESKLSDIDFAVLFSDQVEPGEYLDNRLKITSEIEKYVEGEIDVSCLNNASVLLRHRAAIKGELIFSSDDELRQDFETRVLQQYEDFKYYIDKNIRATEKQIKKGEFGKAPLKPKAETYFQEKYGNRL